MLLEFRRQYTTPLARRATTWNWTTSGSKRKIEEKVAVLKEQAFKNDQDLLHKCATGEDAAELAEAWAGKDGGLRRQVGGGEDPHRLPRSNTSRRSCRPTISWTRTAFSARKLMELRNLNYYDMPLAELRKKRGVKVIVANETAH